MASNSYEILAKFYDRLMSDYPYESALNFVLKNAKGRGVELGTGTGRFAIALTKCGLKTVGVDSSMEMLSEAMKNARRACVDTVFINADVTEYELFPCDFVIAPCDVLNYVLDEGEIEALFSRVHGALSPGGVFIFDLSTKEKHESIASTYLEEYDDLTLVWDNSLDGNLAYLDLVFFERCEDGKYTRHEESHVQRSYPASMLVELLGKIGFNVELFDENFLPSKEERGNRYFIKATKI